MDLGAITSSGSINAKLQESPDNSSWSDLSGTAVSMTAVTTASKLYTFEARADNMTAGKRYARLQIKEVNSANVLVCVVGYGDEADSKKGSANNGTAVTTQNVVT